MHLAHEKHKLSFDLQIETDQGLQRQVCTSVCVCVVVEVEVRRKRTE